MLELNKQGRAYKEDIIKYGYPIVEHGMTAKDIETVYKIKIPREKRVQLCLGFKWQKVWRGYVPVFDIQRIFQAIQNREL